MPPATSPRGSSISWLRLENAVEDSWPEPGVPIQVPEVRTGVAEVSDKLRQIHDLALWVATLDRYATRDSLEQALGRDKVAILHQEKRLGGDSPLSLVLSQKSGGPADRAIGRSLRVRSASSPTRTSPCQHRHRAAQGRQPGLRHPRPASGDQRRWHQRQARRPCRRVPACFATTTTPWPLPPGCRVLLVSLDEHQHWFTGKRADLLAIALDTANEAVHVAAIEVKARRSDETDAAGKGALDQLNQTLAATRWAAYPKVGSVHSRLWLNRIAEAAYAVARESSLRLNTAELAAIEAFRLGRGSLEWAGVGLVFGPKASAVRRRSSTIRSATTSFLSPCIPSLSPSNCCAPQPPLTSPISAQWRQTGPPLQSTRVRRRA